MNILLMLLAGALIGWFATLIMRTKQSLSVNIIIGVLGALLSGLLLSPLFGTGTITAGELSLPSLLISFFGAVILLGVARLLLTLIKRLGNGLRSEGVARDFQSSANAAEEKILNDSSRQASTRLIFISYRRDDTADITGRIYDRLVQRFGKPSVFKDVDSIPFGTDFRKHLTNSVAQCSVLLVVIGRYWMAEKDNGRRRTDEPHDFVRIELEAALQRDIPIIPLIIQGAAMPSEHELPATIRGLVYRQGIAIRHDPDFHRDMDRLIEGIESYFSPS